MHGEKKDNLLSEKFILEEIKSNQSNQKSLIDSSSCNKPEKKVKIFVVVFFCAVLHER